MRKNSKNESTNGVAAANTTASSLSSAEETPQPKKAMKPAKKAASKVPSKKPAVKSSAKKTSKGAKPAKAQEPSDADIRLRAYFIAERRVQMALQGDSAKDWLEARRQLREEAGLA